MLFLFSQKAALSGRVDRGPQGRAGQPGESTMVLISLFPSVRSPVPSPTRVLPSANLPSAAPGTGVCGGGGAPLNSRCPAPGHLSPACSRAAASRGLWGPRSQTHLRRPPRRVGRVASPRAALGPCSPARPAGEGCGGVGYGGVGGSVRASTASGASGGARAGRSRETACAARSTGQVGARGSGGRRWDRPCAPPRPPRPSHPRRRRAGEPSACQAHVELPGGPSLGLTDSPPPSIRNPLPERGSAPW